MSTIARTTEPGVPKTSRAVMLLRQLVETHGFDRETLAHELIVPAHRLDEYLDGTREMPLDRQLCLALFLIERVPALARKGHGLRGQVVAAMTFARHTNADEARPTFARTR